MSTQKETQTETGTERENEYPDLRDDCPPVDPSGEIADDIREQSSISHIPTRFEMSQNGRVETDLYDFASETEWIGILGRLGMLPVDDSVDSLPAENTVEYTGKYADFNDRMYSVEIPGDYPTVKLTGDCVHNAHVWAKIRNESYEGIDGGDVFDPDADSEEQHVRGILGELAFAKFCDQISDSDVFGVVSRGDDGYDFVLDGGRTVDVKTTATRKTHNPDLLYLDKKEMESDVYVVQQIVHRDDDAGVAYINIVGWSTRDVLAEAPVVRWPGDDLNKQVYNDDLNDIDDL